MQKIKISEAAKTLGIAPETLRHYEKKHIIKPEKADGSGYRFFTMNDLCVLSKVRGFMQYGFSIDDSYQLVMSEGIEQTKEMLLSRADTIQEDIRLQMAKLQSLYARMNLINRAMDNIGRFSLRTAEDYYLLEQFDKKGNLIGDFEQNSDWINQTITYPFSIMSGKDFSSGILNSKMMGLSLEASQRTPEIEISVNTVHIFLGKCIYTGCILNSQNINPITESVNTYLSQMGLSLRGDIMERTISTMITDGEISYLAELWIPVN